MPSTKDTFQESDAKKQIRGMLRDATDCLCRSQITYMGLPGNRGLDIIEIAKSGHLTSAIGIDRKMEVLLDCNSAIARTGVTFKPVVKDLWQFLQTDYRSLHTPADVAFLDFCGGGLSDAPFVEEINALRSFFVTQKKKWKDKAGVFAWTYNPRDLGISNYVKVVKSINIPAKHKSAVDPYIDRIDRIRKSGPNIRNGTTIRSDFRSVAIRVVLANILNELSIQVHVWQHAVYRNGIMNCLIFIYSVGSDQNCVIRSFRTADDALLTAPVFQYIGSGNRPISRTLLLFD